MSESKLFFGGVPVGPDVDLLERTFPDLKHEQVLTHDELSAIIGYSRPSPRYWSVMKAWKDRLFEYRKIEMITVRSVGYRVMTSPERADHHVAKAYSKIKEVVKESNMIAAVPRDELPRHVQEKADNARTFISKMGIDLGAFRKTVLGPPKPAETAPRTPPPEVQKYLEEKAAKSTEQQGDENAPVQSIE